MTNHSGANEESVAARRPTAVPATSQPYLIEVPRDKETLIVATFYRSPRQRRQVVHVQYPAANFTLTLDSNDAGDSLTGRLPRIDANATGHSESATVTVTDNALQARDIASMPRVLSFYDSATGTGNALIVLAIDIEP
jgi:hypothetical protein